MNVQLANGSTADFILDAHGASVVLRASEVLRSRTVLTVLIIALAGAAGSG